MRNILLVVCHMLVIQLVAQDKRDYIWLLGDNQLFPPEFGAIKFDFNVRPFEVSERNGGLGFDQNTASICDKEGNLLFYSNGCAVANRLHQVMPNGDSINHGRFLTELWEDDCSLGYPGRQDITILPDPGNEDGYYLIHKPVDRIEDRFQWGHENINHSYVDMSKDEGMGAIISKNDTLYKGAELMSGFLSVIGHANGDDWWIIQPLFEGNNSYLRILLTSNGFEDQGIQEIGPEYQYNTSAGGLARFSPDGTKYANYSEKNGLYLFDFDRESGFLSNYRTVNPTDTTRVSFASCEWSANSRFLYYHTADSLWQVDTYEENLEDGRVFIAEWDPDSSDRPPRFNNTALGPDCRIYVRGGSSNNYMHVIHKPDEKGLACDFQQSAIRLPHLSSTGSFPNFPRFRVDEAEKCDPSIVSIVGETVWWRRDLTVYPSPTTGPITIELPEDHHRGMIYVLDMQGQMVLHREVELLTGELSVDLSYLPSGIYSVEYVGRGSDERVVWTKRVVVE